MAQVGQFVRGLLDAQSQIKLLAEAVRLAGHELLIICLTVPQKRVGVGDGMGIARVLSGSGVAPVVGHDGVSAPDLVAAAVG